jgi:D-amino-acid dehydrogenase
MRSELKYGLMWLLKSDAPLLVNPKPSWHKISWFAEFIASMPHYRRNTIETARLAVAARRHLLGWAAAASRSSTGVWLDAVGHYG